MGGWSWKSAKQGVGGVNDDDKIIMILKMFKDVNFVFPTSLM